MLLRHSLKIKECLFFWCSQLPSSSFSPTNKVTLPPPFWLPDFLCKKNCKFYSDNARHTHPEQKKDAQTILSKMSQRPRMGHVINLRFCSGGVWRGRCYSKQCYLFLLHCVHYYFVFNARLSLIGLKIIGLQPRSNTLTLPTAEYVV